MSGKNPVAEAKRKGPSRERGGKILDAVSRGGSWDFGTVFGLVGYRDGSDPRLLDNRDGFRIARTKK